MEVENISGTISDGWQEAYRMFENRLMGSLRINCSGEHEAKAGSTFWCKHSGRARVPILVRRTCAEHECAIIENIANGAAT